ncbi:MAG: gliding motility lipoprotein GldJ [Bacteroidetes bacterium]|nr:MAG: gliding motility lipoprotein GldJ [Bacteroidota bacterium]
MNHIKKLMYGISFFVLMSVLLTGCKDKKPTSYDPGGASSTTGRQYTSKEGKEGTFTVRDFKGQPEGPNLVYIEGGRHILGTFEEDLMSMGDHLERTVTIASFFMDETEVANIHWLEYLAAIKDTVDEQKFKAALPDTLVWAQELAFNDPYIDHYFRYPGFRFFPVVGVSWRQAQDFSRWRTDAVNQTLAIKGGNKDEKEAAKGGERIPLESGVVLPPYRLPTEAEWEYAAKALVGTVYLDENQDYQRIYPWDGHSLRNPYGKQMGFMLANYRRGRGDYAGIAGKLNDGAMITEWIYAFPPNDYGLYNMSGNVNEWVEDIYRPLSHQGVSALNPVRTDGQYLVDSATRMSNPRRIKDPGAGMDPGVKDPSGRVNTFYDQVNTQNPGGTTLVGDNVRVYKGGSWSDGAYWLSPGTRRYLEQDSATSTIGFRCAMIRAGTNH